MISIPKTLISFSCQSSKPAGEEDSSAKKEREDKPLMTLPVISGVSKLGKRLKETLSPKQKGDLKDVLLMSFSFGVYVYISQKIVCAYCAWMSMLW
uniref:Uncharacterized protein n=1 Tax=Chenopodium quinoa TaxID=63459 RepID=A0A803LC08_CHEQI